MPHLLHLDSFIQGDTSVSRGLIARAAERWRAIHPGGTVTYRDLALQPIPHLDAATGMARLLPPEQHTPAQQESHALSRQLIGEITVKLTAAQSNGALGVLQTVVNPGGGAIPHAHGREEEAFYVLSGDFDFVNGDQILRAGPGDLVFIPRGNRHGFTNIGALPATLLTFIFPAGHEQFWIDNGDDPVPGGHPPAWGPDKLGEVAAELARHQVTVMPDRPDG